MTEAGILARIGPRLPAGTATLLGPGDDAAVVAVAGGRAVVTTDVLVEGRHFRRDWSTSADVGWRAAMQNLADIAAMGAYPTALVVALAVPGALEATWVEGLADGLAEACEPYGVGVVGGDLSTADQVVISVTALGNLNDVDAVVRSGARPGDVVALAGTTGWSAAGLAVLSAGAERQTATAGAGGPEGSIPPSTGALAGRAATVFRRPEPPLRAGPAAARAGVTAMIDTSDGLLADARRLAEASGVVIQIDAGSPALAGPATQLEPLARFLGGDSRRWVMTGGEDHALLATFPAGRPLSMGFAAIGRVEESGRGRQAGIRVDGNEPVGMGGWDHFAKERRE
jgi:thiamine-monophosphate kinase